MSILIVFLSAPHAVNVELHLSRSLLRDFGAFTSVRCGTVYEDECKFAIRQIRTAYNAVRHENAQ